MIKGKYKRINKVSFYIKCKECSVEVLRYILGYTDYPELRYDINNGISLCQFHHPRKKIDEISLSPYFKELVETKSF